MAWTEITRRRYERSGGKYASDATDAEWALIAPLMPAVRRIGRPRTTDLREVFNAILYIATTGCQWRMLPNDFPPVSTVRRYFYDWRDNGLLRELNSQLVATARQAEGRAPGPSAGVIDSQSVKTTESGGVRGYDAGKRIKGRKRHIVTDTIGLLVGLAVHGADVQDRDGAPDLLKSIAIAYPLLRHIFADGGYAGPKLRGALEKIGRWTLQIVKRSDTAKGFEVIPRRWVVERTFAWLGRCRRMAKDWEKTGKKPSQVPKPGSSSPTSGASPACSQAHDISYIVSNQTLSTLSSFAGPLHIPPGQIFPTDRLNMEAN